MSPARLSTSSLESRSMCGRDRVSELVCEGMEHSGRWGRILKRVPFLLELCNFAMKLLDHLTPMLIREAGLGGGGGDWCLYGC